MKVTDKHILFYTEWPSNFCKTCFKWTAFGETHEFFCTEQAFMWAKSKYFNDNEVAEKILAEAESPMVCKQLGRMVNNYDDKQWSYIRYSFMFEVNLCKYQQDARLQEKLLSDEFKDKTFVEASPTDCIWGIGLSINDPNADKEECWKGTNLLGQALTGVRDILSKGKTNK